MYCSNPTKRTAALGCSIKDAGETEAEASFLSGRAATKRTDRNDCTPERIRQSEMPGTAHSDCKAGDGDESDDRIAISSEKICERP